LQNALVTLVPWRRRLVDHHYALVGETELHEPGLADVGPQPARLFDVLIVGELGITKSLNHPIKIFAIQPPRIHSEKGGARRFGELHEVFPAVGIVLGLPTDTLYFLEVDEARETAHAVAFDEGNHVIFEAGKVVR